MGFVNLLSAEMVVDYGISVVNHLSLSKQILIARKYHKTHLALEGAKAIISRYFQQHTQKAQLSLSINGYLQIKISRSRG
jgi:hypothetical protein